MVSSPEFSDGSGQMQQDALGAIGGQALGGILAKLLGSAAPAQKLLPPGQKMLPPGLDIEGLSDATRRLLGFADGGMSTPGSIQMGPPVITGDSNTSKPNPEMTAPIMDNGQMGVAVMPLDKMAEGSQTPAFQEGYAAMSQGQPDPQRMKADKDYLAGVMAAQAEAQPAAAEPPMGGMPMAANGGVFSNTWYSPTDIANAPSIQKLAGNMNVGAFGGTKLDYSLPGTDVSLPAANRLNITNFSRMRPSEQGFIQGVAETPREMGGAGLDWGDYLTDAARAAPTGARFGAAVYG